MHAILKNLDQLLNDLFPFLINYISIRIFTNSLGKVCSDCSSELGNHHHSNLQLKLSLSCPPFILAFLNPVDFISY